MLFRIPLLFFICYWLNESRVLCNPYVEIKLQKDLFSSDRYRNTVRPVLHKSRSTPLVFKSFHLYCVMDLDEKVQVMKSSGWLTLTWEDQLLKWNTSTYGGLERTLVSQDSVWKPDIVVNNAVDTVNKGMGFSGLSVSVTYNGTVTWEPGDVFQTLCTVDVSRFPFDTQLCTYEFSTWMYFRADINITVERDSVDMNYYHENGEWEVMKTQAWAFDESYEPYAGAIYSLKLRRRRGVYILNIIVPIVLLSFLNSFVFILPAESGEKTALCVTSMLSFMVYLSSIVDMVPKTSLNVPLIVVYLVIMLSFSAISVILTVIVLFTYQKQNSNIPSCFKFLVRCFHSNRDHLKGRRRRTPRDATETRKNGEHEQETRLDILRTRIKDEDENGGHNVKHMDDESDVIEFDDWEERRGDLINWRQVSVALDRLFFYVVFSLSTTMSASTLCLLIIQ